MPISYSISRENRLIKAYASGLISAPEIHELLDAILSDPALGPGLRGLYDARNAEPDLSVIELADIAKKVRQLINRGLGRIAIIAESETTYRISAIFSVLARALGIDVDVFRDFSSADAWLNEGETGRSTSERLALR